MNNNKGFTLVELLVAISILAILTMLAIPTLRAFQDSNSKTQYFNYAKSIVSSAKLYNDSYEEDLFGNLDNGCQKVTLTEMINKKVAKDIELKDVTCNKRDKDSYVLIWKYNKEYAYDSVVNCENSKGVSQYSDKEAKSESCLTANGIPYIRVNTISNEANTTKKKSVVITLNDEFGFIANQEIEYAWSTINNADGVGVTGYKSYKYNNTYVKRKDDTVKLSSKSITIPESKTGTYYLYVKPIRVQNIIGESINNVHKYGPYRFDHTAPSCPKIKALKSDGTEVAKNKAAQISKFTIAYSEDDLQNYEFKISYDNGKNYSKVETYSKDKKEYIPTTDGTIKIMTRAKDYANNQSSWCTSDSYIRDTTSPNAPVVTGYKKKNDKDIKSGSGLNTHPSDTWLNGWILVIPSKSTDANGVKYYYTATGHTANAENKQADYRNVNAESDSTVKFKACDNAGNCSGWTTYIAKLDRTAPTCDTANGSSTTWTNSNRTIKQACSDSLSGCTKKTYDTTYKDSIKRSSVTIKDNVGNSNNCEYDVYIDKDKPTCGTATGTSKKWTNKNRTIKQGCSDKLSGCAKSTFEKEYNSGTTKTGSITISDAAGNSEKCNVDVYVDQDPPKLTISNMRGTDGATSVKKSNCLGNNAVTNCISTLKGHNYTFEYETNHNCNDGNGSGCRDDVWLEIWNHDAKKKCGSVNPKKYITWRSYNDCGFGCGGATCHWTEQYEKAYDYAGNESNEVRIYTTIEY